MKPLEPKVFRDSLALQPSSQKTVNSLIIFVTVCVILYFGREILIPIVLAALLSLLLAFPVRFLQRIHIPKLVAILFVVALSFAALLACGALLAGSLTQLAEDLPRYESNLNEKARSLKFAASPGRSIEKAANVLEDLKAELETPTPTSASKPGEIRPIPVEVHETRLGPLDPLLTAITLVSHLLAQFGIVVLMVVFILFNREDLRNRFIHLAGSGDIHRTTLALEDAGHRLSKLFASQLLLNSLTGTFLGICFALIGVPGALLWGALTVILRFVPYIGTMLASIFPIALAAAIGDGWWLALVTTSLIICTEIAVGHILEPLFFGKMTGLSPVAIVTATAFWAALWGPIGLILATPMTIGLLVIGRNMQGLAFLEVLLGSQDVLPPDQRFYQRLLAGDPAEATAQAEAWIKANDHESFLAKLAVPALMLAQGDHVRGLLSRENQTAIAFTLSEVLEDIWTEPEYGPEQPVYLVAAHGGLNFAAMLAFSAMLRVRHVPHTLLPEDAVKPGHFPDMGDFVPRAVCCCYLTAPGEAQADYIFNRISTRLPDSEWLVVAWSGTTAGHTVLTPQNGAAMLAEKAAQGG